MNIEILEEILKGKEIMLNKANTKMRKAGRELAKSIEHYDKISSETAALKQAIAALQRGE